jgi:hypothetical protein
MFALGALMLIGHLVLNTNRAFMSEHNRLDNAEFGITAIALAQSLVEEAMGKYFDANPETSISGEITSTSDLTAVGSLGHAVSEKYRDGTNDFNDFDDFNNLFLVYKSSNPADTAKTTGSDWETIIPNLEAKTYVKARVEYVKVNGSNIPIADSVSNVQTWHKKITVTVINPTTQDSLKYSAIMSYWR